MLLDAPRLVDDPLENTPHETRVELRRCQPDKPINHGAFPFGVVHRQPALPFVRGNLKYKVDPSRNQAQDLGVHGINAIA